MVSDRRYGLRHSIFIEFLRAKDKSNTILAKLEHDRQLFISSVTRFELMAGATSEDKKQDVNC